ncbi:MAG: glycosyltransferase family 4 protein [bacterium]
MVINKKYRILHLVHGLHYGGVLTIIKSITELNQDNTHTFIIKYSGNGVNFEKGNLLINKSNTKLIIPVLFSIIKYIRKNKINIIHCHPALDTLVYAVLVKIIFFGKVKLIIHEHGAIIGPESNNTKFYRKYLLLNKIIKPFVNNYICVSEYTKDQLIKRIKISQEKISVLHNFVNTTKYNLTTIDKDKKHNLAKIWNIYDDHFNIGFVGRLVKIKGWEDFVDAAKTLVKKYENLRFYIAGDGPERDLCKEKIQHNGLNEYVFDLGYIPEPVYFYSMLNLFVISSHQEGVGIVQLEAQSMGVPVIASNIPSLMEVLNEDNSNNFRVFDSEDLAKTIENVFLNKELQKKLIKNGSINAQQYSFDNYIKKLEKIYLLVNK